MAWPGSENVWRGLGTKQQVPACLLPNARFGIRINNETTLQNAQWKPRVEINII